MRNKLLILLSAALLSSAAVLSAQLAVLDFDNDINLTSSNLPDVTAWSPGDNFEVGNGASPDTAFTIADDSVGGFPNDELGILSTTGPESTNNAFIVTDTVNGDNLAPISAEWVFSLAAVPSYGLLIDMAAMGDFEINDSFRFSYSWNGTDFMDMVTVVFDDDAEMTYTLDDGDMFTLADPLSVNGTLLTNEFQTFGFGLTGTGTELTLRFTALTDGSEGFVFDNVQVIPEHSTYVMLAGGLLALALILRRRR